MSVGKASGKKRLSLDLNLSNLFCRRFSASGAVVSPTNEEFDSTLVSNNKPFFS